MNEDETEVEDQIEESDEDLFEPKPLTVSQLRGVLARLDTRGAGDFEVHSMPATCYAEVAPSPPKPVYDWYIPQGEKVLILLTEEPEEAEEAEEPEEAQILEEVKEISDVVLDTEVHHHE